MQSADTSASIQAIQSHAEESLGAAQRAVEQVRAAEIALRGIEHIAGSIPVTVEMVGEAAEHANFIALNAMIEAFRAGETQGGFASVAPEVEALAVQATRTMDALTGLAGAAAHALCEPARENPPTDGEPESVNEDVATFFERLNLS